MPELEADEAPPELRRTERQGAYRVVTVTYPSGYIRKGVIVDLSATGARIRFSQRGELPDRVTLRIEGLSGNKEADMVWQEAYDAGVRFCR
ncbi:MAG: PilZ domain-containing protein [Pseudomonadota bacterium]